jgi:protease I
MKNKKIIILMESDYYEPEIAYYQHRFTEDNIDVHFMSRLWGQPNLTFTGHENRLNTFYVDKSFEDLTDEDLNSYSAVIVPSGMVSDRLRYTEDVNQTPPAALFLKRAFENKNIIKGLLCHSLWLVAPVSEIIKDRKLTCHNNLYSDALAYGAEYQNEDFFIDEDLVSARTGAHCHLLAKNIIEMIKLKEQN